MKISWLQWIGYLGFLGFLGFFEKGLFGFFGFFSMLGAFKNMRHDELLEVNVNKACRNVYILSLLTAVLAIIFMPFFDSHTILLTGFIIMFAIHIVVFWVSLIYYERMVGKNGV